MYLTSQRLRGELGWAVCQHSGFGHLELCSTATVSIHVVSALHVSPELVLPFCSDQAFLTPVPTVEPNDQAW